MFIRLRWFLYGVVISAVVAVMVIKRARALKERLDTEGVTRVVASYGADVVEAAGRALQRSTQRDAGTGVQTGL
ncbi:MAG: hypothetical protein M5U23_07460 [Acidimicrobiia bacterium]|nr:hypothetical protein [Acidimicrobiia bacterium]